jgi:hypothetical protein
MSFVLGAVFVVLYSAERFRSPFADRSHTTFYRYCIAAGYYATGYLGFYYLIAASLSWLFGAGGAATQAADYTSVWIALFAVMVLPHLPPLALIDRAFRKHARVIGGIPTEARLLRNAIRDANREIAEQGTKEIKLNVLRRGLDLGNMRSVPDHTLHGLFQHASELRYLIDWCARQSRFAGFTSDNAKPLHDLARRFDHLVFKSSRGVEAIRGLHELVDSTSGKSDNWESLGSLVENQVYADRPSVLEPAISTSRLLITSLRDDMRFFIDDAAMLLARIALYHAYTERGRAALLRQIGVAVAPIERPRYRSLLSVFAVVFFAMMVSMGLLSSSGVMSDRKLVGLVLMVPTLFVIALFCAIYPKQHFSFANRTFRGRLPYLFFGCAGLASVVLAFVVGLLFRTLIFQNGYLALEDAVTKSPWLLMTFTLAVGTAILVQDPRGFAAPPRMQRRRWLDSISMALALAAAGALIQFLLHYTDRHAPPNNLISIIGWSMLIGGFVGYFVPSRFRLAYVESPEENATIERELRASAPV